MTIIYEPKGKAKEYCSLAANLYRGCGHGCLYCYGPGMLRMKRERFSQAQPRKDVIKKLARSAKRDKFKNKGPVLLCFSCDPYQPINDTHNLTRQAIKILKDNTFDIEILTKGGKRAEADFDLLGPGDKVGATLTFINADDSLKWEPNAALPAERMAMLEKAKSCGLQTWVSLEPVIDPVQALEIIQQTHTFIDTYKVGKLNYHRAAAGVDWRKFTADVIALLDELENDYYIKESLQPYFT